MTCRSAGQGERSADLTAMEEDPSQAVRPGLRVKPYPKQAGVMEMTWAPDGRALFMFGEAIQPGKRHVRWLRIGTHEIF